MKKSTAVLSAIATTVFLTACNNDNIDTASIDADIAALTPEPLVSSSSPSQSAEEVGMEFLASLYDGEASLFSR